MRNFIASSAIPKLQNKLTNLSLTTVSVGHIKGWLVSFRKAAEHICYTWKCCKEARKRYRLHRHFGLFFSWATFCFRFVPSFLSSLVHCTLVAFPQCCSYSLFFMIFLETVSVYCAATSECIRFRSQQSLKLDIELLWNLIFSLSLSGLFL